MADPRYKRLYKILYPALRLYCGWFGLGCLDSKQAQENMQIQQTGVTMQMYSWISKNFTYLSTEPNFFETRNLKNISTMPKLQISMRNIVFACEQQKKCKSGRVFT